MFTKHHTKYKSITLIVATAIVIALFIAGCSQFYHLEQPAVDESPEINLQPGEQINTPSEIYEQPDAEAMYPLFFNTPEVTGSLNISPVPPDFWLDATEEQLRVAFPMLEFDMLGTVSYYRDGTFAELRAHVPHPNPYDFGSNIVIWAGESFVRTITSDYIFDDGFVPEYSNVDGISVIAQMIDGWDESSFRATFTIDNIEFHIRLRNEDPNVGQRLLTEIVNKVILGGIEGFAVFDNPTIPELRSESITLEEALADSDFGEFVPTIIPDGFVNRHGAHRSVQGHIDDNTLFIEWNSSLDYDYLYTVFTNWLERRDSDTEVFDFDDIFWGEPSIWWTITNVSEHDLESLVSADNRELYDWSLYPLSVWIDDSWDLPRRDFSWDISMYLHNPVFPADEMTLDIVRAREDTRYISIQGADGAVSENPADINFPLLRTYIMFGVLFDDVLIRINADGLTYEEVWTMLSSIRY